jgi:hypothetical protein
MPRARLRRTVHAALALTAAATGCGGGELAPPLGAAAAPITCMTIQRVGPAPGGVEDTMLVSDPADPLDELTSFATTTVMNTGAVGTDARRVALKFDLELLPPGVSIQSATLILRLIQSPWKTPVDLHAISAPWSEPTATWTTLGAAYDPVPLVTFPTSMVPAGSSVSVDVTSFVLAWQSGALPNYGMMLLHPKAGRTSFASSEAPTPVPRPKLQVCYVNPTCNDGVQNGFETGVDCGGFCAACDLCPGVVCAAQDACHDAGTCDPLTGLCSSPAKPDGSPCADADACNGVESCHSGTCQSGCVDPVVQLSGADPAGASSLSVCVRRASGAVSCQGQSGYLGDGTSSSSPGAPVAVVGLTNAVDLATSPLGSHSCAARATGQVVCWGRGAEGQLGGGGLASATAPVTAQGVAGAVSVAAGAYGSCAALADGRVFCWGQGYGAVPVAIAGVNDAVQVTGGAAHACARRAGGGVACWGANASGQLGDGTTAASSAAVQVVGLRDAIDVSAGQSSTCAARATGAVVCWGYGWGTAGSYGPAPVAVGGFADAVSLARPEPLCAARAGGLVRCWDAPGGADVPGLGDAHAVTASGPERCAVRQWGSVACWAASAGEPAFTALNEVCEATAPPLCADGNVCTADTCSAAQGCASTPTPGAACDDASVCTAIDVCDAAGACVGSATVSCDDGDACTADACDATYGCQSTFVLGPTCDVCQHGGVLGGPLDCNDENDCTGDACDPATGCAHTARPDGVTCIDSGSGLPGTCAAGYCAP